ncbi:spore coat U domain-containing protein [Acinetobacter gerneri]|uniref:Csu type fimbrial protein n=1 Tax=Acinetobacter gerneri TaxID=202952 RepID=UPI002935DF0C|nr:spore coat U domain-containing protein [Acinetobacter gerneri]MDV2440158.1 spore coat U domain-containing protein [Acinetobacter gerneri]
MRKLGYLALTTVALMSSNAMADTATGLLTVKATVVKSCAVNTPASGTASNAVIDFGQVTSFSQNVDASTSTAGGAKISVLCSNTTPWTVAFDNGQHVDGSQRRMAGGTSEFIPYDLYSDTGRITSIAAGTAYSGTGNGQVQSYDVFGRIPAGSTLPSPGVYVDTVTMTVTY